MIRTVTTCTNILSQVSEPVTDLKRAKEIIEDMLDTAKYHQAQPIGCLGLAAIQIDQPHRIIVIWHGGRFMPMINPEIVKAFGGKDHKREGCLSRPRADPRVARFKKLNIRFMDYSDPAKTIDQRFSGFSARILQHEIDHLDGVFI